VNPTGGKAGWSVALAEQPARTAATTIDARASTNRGLPDARIVIREAS
jgi:hypothetical protein